MVRAKVCDACVVVRTKVYDMCLVVRAEVNNVFRVRVGVRVSVCAQVCVRGI